ncbi:MAG: hypothetical protein ACOC1O_02560 [bacterium]
MFALFLLILFIIIGISIAVMESYDFVDKFANSIVNSVGAFGIWIFIMLFLSAFISIGAETEEYLYSSNKIYALDGNFETNGNFFLGTGSVDESLKYYYLVKKEGGKKIKSVHANNVILYESDNPRIEVYNVRFKRNWLNNNFICISGLKYKLYIPDGSIKQNYKPVPFDN